MRNSFAEKLFEIAQKDKNVILMIGDLGYGVVNKFWEELPDQFINAGIAEQNMLSIAAGLALEGKTVFVYSIANFPTLRALEQIRNDICYHNANVKIVSVGGGFSYGALGMSHHGTEDMAILRALPNMCVFCPADKNESLVVTDYVHKKYGPCYIRLGKGGEPDIHNETIRFDGVNALKIHEGNNKEVVLFATGSIIGEALVANKYLSDMKQDVSIYSFLSIKPLDVELIREVSLKYKKIITLEEHNILGGFGSAIAEIMSEQKSSAILKRIGLNDTYSSIVGSQEYLRNIYNMNYKILIKEII